MEFANANNVYGKSKGSPSIAFAESTSPQISQRMDPYLEWLI
jgi:hypothetical protein